MLTEHVLEPFAPLNRLPRFGSSLEVVVLSYNSAKWLENCLLSIFNQVDPPDTSVLIHDDGSTDASCELIRGFAQKSPFPITLITRSKNSLLEGADFYWEILTTSKSEFVAILDADDFWLTREKLKVQYEALKADSSVALSFHDYASFSDEKDEVSTIFPSHLGLRTLNFFPCMSAENPIGSSTVMFRTSALEKVDMSGREVLPFQDFAVWAQLAAVGKQKYLPRLMTAYRRHDASLSNKKKWIQLFGEARHVNSWLFPRIEANKLQKFLWKIFGSTAIRFLWLAVSRVTRRRRSIDFGQAIS